MWILVSGISGLTHYWPNKARAVYFNQTVVAQCLAVFRGEISPLTKVQI